jgi:serine/threonine protein kinase/tetratricopeptide (TPR) repeat protein
VPTVGTTIAERYWIEAEIGRGGMGTVYRALDLKLERRVALKILSPPDERPTAAHELTSKDLVLREARAAAALQHPNVVAIFDFGEHEGAPYLVMELAEGHSLRRYVGETSVNTAQKVAWLLDVARALNAAHERGVVHRDVKPENVLVTAAGAKVLDFGIAARKTSLVGGPLPPTLRHHVVGTPDYMAPEQIRTQSIDGRADQFAWGVMSYELFTGRLPFKGELAIDVLRSILQDEPQPPSTFAPLPPIVDQVVMRALEKDPARRWPSMQSVLVHLAEVAASVNPAQARERLGDVPTVDATEAARAAVAEESRPGGRAEVPLWAKQTALAPSLGPTDAPAITPPLTPSPLTPSPNLRPWIRAGLLVSAVLAVTAIVLVMLIMRGRSGPEPLSGPSASEAVEEIAASATAVTIDSLPVPTCKPAAVATFREGVGLIREGNWEGAHRRFEAATELDEDCPEAWFRLVMTGRSQYSATKERLVFQRAVTLRSRLTDRDRALLDAYEPLVARDPPDRREFSARLVALAEQYPTDVEVLTKMIFHATTVPLPVRLTSARRATELDPKFSDAWQSLGRTLAESNEPKEALEAYERYTELAIGSTDCLADRLRERSLQGRCAEGEGDARKWIARSPNTAAGYLWHAEVLAAQIKPRESVEAVLKQRWSKLPVGSAEAQLERAKLAALYGDFETALTELDAHEQLVASDLNVEPHARGRLFALEILLELGRTKDARKVADRFFAASSAWTANIAADAQQLPVYLLPQQAARISRKSGEPVRAPADWLSLATKDGTLNPVASWLFTDGMFAMDAAEARKALERSPVPLGTSFGLTRDLPKGARSPTTAFELGRVLQTAERPEAARHFFQLAAGSCGAFGDTLASTQALYALGSTLEDVNKPGACKAYSAVLARWAGSQSRTAKAVAARHVALDCPKP